MMTWNSPKLLGCLAITVLIGASVLFADTQRNFEKIDRHARQVPVSEEKSVETLARYLTAPAKNDLEKARAIFIWMTHNLTYHVNYSDRRKVSESPDDVLKSRRAVCSGFSGLFVELAEKAGLEAVTINGLAKGYGYLIGEPLNERSRHAWNGVKIDGEWRLLDTTWGAGFMDGKSRYVRSFNDFYFFPPPENLIYSHFPYEFRWQLIKRPLVRWEFENQLYLKSYFFKHNFPHPEISGGTLKIKKKGSFRLKVPEKMAIQAKLFSVNKPPNDLDMHVQYSEDAVDIEIASPDPGDYVLRVFGKPGKGQEEFDWILDARVQISAADVSWSGFPEMFNGYHESRALLITPNDGVLSSGERVPFCLNVPGALKVMVKSGKKWTRLKKKGDRFFGKVLIGQSPVQVFGALESPTKFSLLLQYDTR